MRRFASFGVAVCLALGSLLVAPSATANPRVEPCIREATGTNLQQYFQINVSIVAPPAGCDQIKSGTPWSTPLSFFLARTWEQMPADYHPVGATPLAELEAHLTEVRWIVDEGTPHEFTVVRSGSQIHWVVADWQVLYPDDPDWLFVDVGTHFVVHPLSVGTHTVRGQFVMDGSACDGTSSEYDLSCIPPGVFDFPDTRTFSVVP